MSHVSAQLPTSRHHAFHGTYMPHAQVMAPPHEIQELDVQELRFCHLQSSREIARVLHLRQEIHLPSATVSDPGFAACEKKETRLVLSVLLSGADNSSGRSGSFQSDWAWRRVKPSCKGCRSFRPTGTRKAGRSAGWCLRPSTAPNPKS